MGGIARGLLALPIIPCITENPRIEFEERAEIERFETRARLSEIYEPATKTATAPSLLSRFMSAAFGKPRRLSAIAFTKIDVNRTKWYEFEVIPRQCVGRDTILSKEGIKELAEQICEDFGINVPRTIKLCYPKKETPSFFSRKKKKADTQTDGLYHPQTTDMSLRYNAQADGFSKHTLLHELAHHIDNLYVHNGENAGAPHGMRFKRIHMHLMHHYDDVSLEDLLGQRKIQVAYGIGFPLRADDILRRDFTESRTIDIVPHVKSQKNPFSFASYGLNTQELQHTIDIYERFILKGKHERNWESPTLE